ncbi:hypothetical protein DM02DRAFT_646106 [Periconia macrospinosa]|uniref:Zn(2)-C6 fungal-type domain-containing protein n=1 Tax=Periconia macrospinosa TaxID=97972 RepID=A0A2V1D7K1_9PLEO|nr:hypothetical protein DM02DRAFT_646106 [Periconia macrospinosa]
MPSWACLSRCYRCKVKCISKGTNFCKNCVLAGLAYTYNAIPQKKGLKGNRVKVLSELRENQGNAQLTTVGTFARILGLLPISLIKSCLEFFFANHSTEAYCIIVALYAYVIIQANIIVPPELLPRSKMAQLLNISIGHILVEEAIRQLCVSQSSVSSVAADNSMTFTYPIKISRDLLSITHQFLQRAMEVYSIGLTEKLFDIACCLTDVVACIPFPPDTFALSPQDCTYYLYLIAKVSEVLPNLPLPPLGSGLGLAPSSFGAVPSNIGNDLSSLTLATSPSYLSTELIR